jgi:hypothetical protein
MFVKTFPVFTFGDSCYQAGIRISPITEESMSADPTAQRPLQAWLEVNATLQETYRSAGGLPTENDVAMGYPKWEVYNLDNAVDAATAGRAFKIINAAIKNDLGDRIVGKANERLYLASYYDDGAGNVTDIRIPTKTIPLLSAHAQTKVLEAVQDLSGGADRPSRLRPIALQTLQK